VLLTRNCRITLAMGELLRKEADYMLVCIVVRKLKLVERSSSLLCERREASFLTGLKPCVS